MIEWTHVVYMVLGAVATGIAWIGKTILQPWSESKLKDAETNRQNAQTERQKADATTKLVDVLAKGFPALTEEVAKQTVYLESQNEKLASVDKTLIEMGSDNKRLCRVDQVQCKAPATLEALERAIVELKTLVSQGSDSAATLLGRYEIAKQQIEAEREKAASVVTEAADIERRGLEGREVKARARIEDDLRKDHQ